RPRHRATEGSAIRSLHRQRLTRAGRVFPSWVLSLSATINEWQQREDTLLFGQVRAVCRIAREMATLAKADSPGTGATTAVPGSPGAAGSFGGGARLHVALVNEIRLGLPVDHRFIDDDL